MSDLNKYEDINIVFQLDEKLWSQFVKEHPTGNIFHTPEMADLYRRSSKQEPILVALVNKKNEIRGLLLAVIQSQLNGVFGKVTARSVSFSTPLVKNNNPQLIKLILKAYDNVVKNKAIYSQFRNFCTQDNQKEIFINQNYKYEDHLNIQHDLSLSDEELLNQMHKRLRRNIRRAVKKGLTFREITDSQEIEEVFFLIENTYKRIKLPFPNKDYFDNAYQVLFPKGMIRYFAAVFEKKIISVRIELCYKGIIYDWWTGYMNEFLNKYPNDFLPWQVMLWGHRNGYKTFDFGGAGKPGIPYGVRDHKLKFGGKLLSFGRYEKIHKPLFMALGKLGMKLYKILK